MRVTHRMLVRTALRDLQNSTQRLGKYQEQLSTGKRIHRPSDDPFAVDRALSFRSELQALETSKSNIDLSRDWIDATDVTLSSMTDIIIRARNVATRGAEDSVGEEGRFALAQEAAQLLGSAIQAANTSSQERYLFAGYKVDDIPFVGLDSGGNPVSDPMSIASVQYNGDGGNIIREVEPGVTLQVNFNGQEAWLDPANTSSVFSGLLALRDALLSQDGNGIRDALDTLDGSIELLGQARAVAGARNQRLDLASDKLDSITLGLESLLSKTEDADIAEAAVNFSQEEALYKASLQVNARILPVSLLDYLR